MEHSTVYESDSGIYVVRVSGDYHRGRDSEMNKRLVSREFQAHGYRRFLFDMRGVRIQSDAIATYDAGSVSSGLREHLQHVRTAQVVDRISEDDRFFENVTVNRGFVLRVFTDLDEARAWLQAG